MSSPWSETKTGYTYQTSGLCCKVGWDVSGDFCAELSVPGCPQFTRLLEPISLHFLDPAGNPHELRPRPAAGHLENTSLVIPIPLEESDIGLQLTTRFQPSTQCLNLEFRIQTVLPITQLVLRVGFSSRNASLEFPLIEPKPAGPNEKYSATDSMVGRFRVEGRPVLLLLVDPGERGTAEASELEDAESSITYSLFRQPLEKGVILVGRFGLLPQADELDRYDLRNLYDRWLAKLTFL